MDPTELLERLNKIDQRWLICPYETPVGRRFFLSYLPEGQYEWHYFYGETVEEVFEQLVRANP